MPQEIPTILIIDDDETRRGALISSLARRAWKIVSATDGATGLTAALAGVDVVIMPEIVTALDASDLQRRVCSTELGRFTGVLRLHTSGALENGDPGGLTHDLNWPAQPDALISTVALMLKLKEAQVTLRDTKEALRHQTEHLEEKIADRTALLRESISQMEEFSYTVSHDLRAPLRSIKGYAEVLLNDYGHKLKGDGPRFLERIIESGDRMERLVNDVLKISRISSSKLSLGAIDLNSMLEGIIREYPNLNASVARITVETIPRVVGHESLCTQVFANLLGNAVKFVRSGVVPEVQVFGQLKDGVVRIVVSDNGIGVSPEHHQKIFGMFERLDPDNQYGGTGIGLAIVRRAAEKMNGRVGIESDGQSGSRFWIELPAAL